VTKHPDNQLNSRVPLFAILGEPKFGLPGKKLKILSKLSFILLTTLIIITHYSSSKIKMSRPVKEIVLKRQPGTSKRSARMANLAKGKNANEPIRLTVGPCGACRTECKNFMCSLKGQSCAKNNLNLRKANKKNISIEQSIKKADEDRDRNKRERQELRKLLKERELQREFEEQVIHTLRRKRKLISSRLPSYDKNFNLALNDLIKGECSTLFAL